MKRILGILMVVGLAATPALAQKVNIDYAHEFDFSKVKTFQYVDTKESNMKDDLMHDRIKNKIIEALENGGLKQVESDPDIFVTYHTTTKDQQVYNTTSFGYGGYGGGWYGWGAGMGTSTTTATTYTQGTLIIDAYGPDDKKMVWRGMGTVTLKSKPENQVKQIDKILAKLGSKWQKILAMEGK